MNTYNLYQQFLTAIESTQDKKSIIDNMLKGQKYAIFSIEPSDFYESSELVVKLKNTTRTLPQFEKNEIYLPYLDSFDITLYMDKFLELSLLEVKKLSNHTAIIDLNKSLKNYLNNKKSFDSHQISFYNTPKKLKFSQDYYKICNYIKQTIQTPINPKYAFVVNFDFKTNRYNLRIVNPDNFNNFEYLFFIDDKKTLREASNLMFNSKVAARIDMEKSMSKIDLFEKIKDF